MKVSEFLREYQITGNLPDPEEPLVSFWAGWLVGNARIHQTVNLENAIEMAIKAAEFIEGQK